MTQYRLLQSGYRRLLENGTDARILEGDVGLIRRYTVAAFARIAGPTAAESGGSEDIEAHTIVYARMDKPSNTPTYANHQVLYLPGGGGKDDSWMQDTSTNPSGPDDVIRDCTHRGIHMRRTSSIPTDWTWGNDELLGRVDSFLLFAEANYGFSPPYHLVGASMGTLCCLNWAVRNPDLVASVSLLLPLVNPQLMDTDGRLRGNNTSGRDYSGSIPLPSESGWPGGVPNAYNPISRGTDFQGIPIKMWASHDDEVCFFSEATTFAADSGATLVDMGNMGNTLIYGHSLNPKTGAGAPSPPVGHFTASQIQDWMIANDL